VQPCWILVVALPLLFLCSFWVSSVLRAAADPMAQPEAGSPLATRPRRSSCVDVAGSVQSAAEVGAKVAQGSITQTDAAAQLEPIATKVTSLAKENAALPIGKNLQKLSDSIVALQKVSPNTPTDFQAAAETLAAQTKIVVADCAAIGK